jgi:maltooligosyltrehalose trehalohydrolase
VALGLVLTSPFIPILFMGEEFAASAPFLFFADHEEDEMRRLVAEGRKRDFEAFGWKEEDIPDPEAVETFERSKLGWNELRQGKHAEMLEWVKQLIQLRRTTVDLNDGDLGHLEVECRDEDRSLTMRRGSVRVLINLGNAPTKMKLLEGESIRLRSCGEIAAVGKEIALPQMSLAIVIAAIK